MLKFVLIFLKDLKEYVLDLLFPPTCAICGKIDKNYLCKNCKNRIQKYEKYELIVGKEKIIRFLDYNKDKKCKYISEKKYYNSFSKDKISKEIFLEYRKKANLKILNKKIICDKEIIFFDEMLYCFDYKGVIRKILLKYKFSDCSYLSSFFANIMLNNEKINEIFKKYDIIISVPMDKQKKLKRGYNQTELILESIRKKINYMQLTKDSTNILNKILIDNDCLIKVRKTKTQSTLNLIERKENIKNAFSVKNKDIIKNKNVVLFDDIYTTGATVNEISKILKEAGAKKILVLVIAKD